MSVVTGPGGILQDNVTLTVEEERTAKDTTTGRNTPGWTSIATGVSAFLGLPAGGRAGDFLSAHERTTATLVSSSPYVGRSDVRFKVTAVGDSGLTVLLDVYLRVESSADYPGGVGPVVPRYEAKVSVFAVPS